MINYVGSASSQEDLNKTLKIHNPFCVSNVKANQIWGEGFPDVKTINSHASDAVFQALEQIQCGHYSTTSMVITAQNGTGKTHIISRIRHRLQAEGGGLFVYAAKYSDLNNIRHEFQQILAESLGKLGSQGVSQWQELSTNMVNQAMTTQSKPQTFSSEKLVELFKKKEEENEDEIRIWVKKLTKAFCRTQTVNDPDIVRAILWTLSESENLYAVKWLGGQELAAYKAEELMLPTQHRSFDSVLQILDLISNYNQLVVCFDELDTPDAYNDHGLHVSAIISGLIKDLLQNMKRGLILSVMMPNQWSDKVKQLPGGVSDKVSAWGKPIALSYMNGQSIIDLATLWLNKFYESKNLVPPDPVYPFKESQLRSLESAGQTVREIIDWCRDTLEYSITNTQVNKQIRKSNIDIAFESELQEDIRNCLENNYIISKAILFGFRTLLKRTIEQVNIEEVIEGVKQNGSKDKYINFKIIGKQDVQKIEIGVAVLQDEGGRSLGAGLKRLKDPQACNIDITRGCLVRSPKKTMSSYLQKTYIDPIVKAGGEFVKLNEEEIRPLLAILSVYEKRDVDYQVSEEEIFQFISDKGKEYQLGINNPLLLEILSDPSYQVPEGAIENEPKVVSQSSLQDTSDSDDSLDIELISNESI